MAKGKRQGFRSFSRFLLIIGIIFAVVAVLFRFGPLGKQARAVTITSSTLTEAIDIAELSTAEFHYRGIADVYEGDGLKCHICYSATVKAGIDMEDVRFDVDRSQKTVTAILPELRITSDIVSEDSMSVIPSSTNISLPEMLTACEKDAQKEALASGELMETAKENLQATIEGLLYPILSPQGYTLIWAEGE